jgi:hypothetical protein
MQGNSFLGAFFRVSPFPQDVWDHRREVSRVVQKQYVKKFGALAMRSWTSNMEVMEQGFARVEEIKYGEFDERPIVPPCATPVAPFGEQHLSAHGGLRLVCAAGCQRR